MARGEIDDALSKATSESPKAPWKLKSPLKGLELPTFSFSLKALSWEVSDRKHATLALTIALTITQLQTLQACQIQPGPEATGIGLGSMTKSAAPSSMRSARAARPPHDSSTSPTSVFAHDPSVTW